MENTNKKILIIACVLSLVTTFLIYNYLKHIGNGTEKVEKSKILVAAHTIEPKTMITLQDLKEVVVEKEVVNSKAFNKSVDIVNKMTKERIFEGEQIIKERLISNNNSTLSYNIPKGTRAVTINVSEATAVGYFIQPGDYVDVTVSIDKDSQEGTPAIAKTIIQNVLVLGVGQSREEIKTVAQSAEKKKVSNASSTDVSAIKTITLAVLPGDVEKVALSEQIGTINLSLRAIGDNELKTPTNLTKGILVQ